jgi:hypothetical protein
VQRAVARMLEVVVGACVLACALLAAPALAAGSGAAAQVAPQTTYTSGGMTQISQAADGVEHFNFAAGPYAVTPGANLILTQGNKVPKPDQNGYIVRIQPNLKYALPDGKCCGGVPLTNHIHLHHGVWLSDGTAGEGEGDGYGPIYPFFASGEEKTIYQFPAGFGYPVAASDTWILNYMIHNLTSRAASVYITYEIDFIPMTSPLADHITPVHPIWMDVEDHHIYPVFNVKQGSGSGGKFTFPDMARNPYGTTSPPYAVKPLNEFTIDHPGTLIATAGHLHPGGLYDTLDLIRPGAHPSGGAMPGNEPNSVRLFRSYAHYWDPRGPISWDMAMTATAADWRPEVQAGDTLRISATYNTTRASWYEVMGIMVVWEAWNDMAGTDPFSHKLDEAGHLTHGHLPENDEYGGNKSLGVNIMKFPECHTGQVVIAAFEYLPGDFTAKGSNRCIPTVKEGESITFTNDDANPNGSFTLFSQNPFYVQSIFHTVTACQNPCGLNTGISYPLAYGGGGFDSGELGIGTPGKGSLSWSTPTNLKPGTYTFFCRIHPWMRGVFRIVG